MKPEVSRLRAKIVALAEQRNEFIAKLIHDVRGPLTSIVGFSELLDEGMLEGEGAADAVRIIRSNAARLAQLTSDLLAMNRAEAGELDLEKKPVDLSKLVTAMSGAKMPDGIVVQGDEQRLTVAIGNVYENAKKFARGVQPQVAVLSHEGVAIVSVIDSGIGIPNDELSSIGERFYRASNAKKEKLSGTGVGLFIAKAIVEAHGGSISFSSNGSGTSASIQLPIAGTAKKSVLLQLPEDEKRYFARALRERGYRVVNADADVTITSAEDALALVES